MPRKVQEIINKIVFSDAAPLIKIGRRKPLEPEDVMDLPKCLHPKNFPIELHNISLENYQKMFSTILRAVKGKVTLMLVFVTGLVAMNLLSPYLVYKFVSFVERAGHGQFDFWQGAIIAAFFCMANISEALLGQHYIYQAIVNERVIINALNYLIYKNTISLSRDAKIKIPSGDIVNYMSIDADAVAMSIWAMMEMIASVLMIIGASIMAFTLLGIGAASVLLIILILMPVSKYLGKRFTKLSDQLLVYRDNRVSHISQILSGIRIVKYFSWIKPILEEVKQVRKNEIRMRRRLALNYALSVLIYSCSNTVVCFLAFGTYLMFEGKLEAAVVFSSMTLFKLLENPLGQISHLISDLASAKVSAERIISYLKQEKKKETLGKLTPKHTALGMTLEEVRVKYDKAGRDVLSEINLKIEKGASLAIVGPVGSGKSTLLLTLMKEIPLAKGEIKWLNLKDDEIPRVAFVPQEAYIQNTSLRDNILFGEPDDLLQEAIRSVDFDRDISALPAGLSTEIGEQGINLSGGQKQRVNLARAMVYQPGLVLLDDPLSASDSGTEDKIMENLVFGHWQNITRIMVTHRLKFLTMFDKIVFLEQGNIVGQGNYAELWQGCERFRKFVRKHVHQENKCPDAENKMSISAKAESPHGQGRLTADEDKEYGAVKLSVYLEYIKALGGRKGAARGFVITSLALITGLVMLVPILQNCWLSVWTSRQPNETGFFRLLGDFFHPLLGSETHNLLVFGMIGLCTMGITFAQYLLWEFRAVNAGKIMHESALKSVLNAPIRFFDSNPMGRILNRFSRDIDVVERELTWTFQQTVWSSLYTLGSILVMAAVLPVILLAIGPLAIVFYVLQRDYRKSGREVKRYSSITRSPRFSHFKETIQGLEVIRSFNKNELFLNKFHKLLAENQRMFYAMIMVNRWFSVRVPLVSAGLSLAVSVAIIGMSRHGLIMAGAAGFIILYTNQFWGYLNWCIRSFSETEARMTSVERLGSYVNLIAEADLVGPLALQEREKWPVYGNISFENVWAKYADHLPYVLKGLSFRIPGGMRVGLKGRTGAGKSSIMQLLFRLINTSQGQVMIDGKDITGIPLETLRRAMAIIPQDPTLFRGKLRTNLDRLGAYSEQEIWQVLQRVYLADFVRGLKNGLDAEVEENGYNFSQGQRQLFCLARALLIDAKIIVMDEATASVDVETDEKIQKVIREEFFDKTLVIIAHRINTIADADMIVEIDDGKAVNITYAAQLSAEKNLLAIEEGADKQVEDVFNYLNIKDNIDAQKIGVTMP